MKKLFWYWLIILLLINIIPLGNDLNTVIHKTSVFKFRLDYLIHCCSFLIFIPLYFIEVKRGGPIFSKKPVLKYILIVGNSAILFESIQYFLPYRTFNPMDLISNLTGAIIGTIIISFFFPSLKNKQATTGN